VVVIERALGIGFCLDPSVRGAKEARTLAVSAASTIDEHQHHAGGICCLGCNSRIELPHRIPCISVHRTRLRHFFFWIVLHSIRGFAGRNSAAFVFLHDVYYGQVCGYLCFGSVLQAGA
jgi:hypothetical protein